MNKRVIRFETEAQRNKGVKERMRNENTTETDKSEQNEIINPEFGDIINPEFDEINNRYSEEDEDGTETGREEDITDDEIYDRLKEIERNSKFDDYNKTGPADGDAGDEKDFTDGDNGISDGQGKEKRSGLFGGDSIEICRKKEKSIKRFLESSRYKKCWEIIDNVLKILLSGKIFSENGIDIISEITEGYVKGNKWDVVEYPDYGRQVMYKFKFNVMPNLLNKYLGKKIKGLTDEEIQEKNFKGESFREGNPRTKTFIRLDESEFEIDTENGKISLTDSEEDKKLTMKTDNGYYKTEEEQQYEEEILKREEELKKMCQEAISKCDDEEVKKLYEIILKSDSTSKINQQAAKKMGKTPEEIGVIKKRLTRYLSKEIKEVGKVTYI